jgi:hypothetical protein
MWVQSAKVRAARWVGGTVFTNPAANTVLADSGAVTAAAPDGTTYEYQVVASSTVAAQIQVQHRDAANASTVESFDVFLPAGVVTFPVQVTLKSNERVRVVLVSGITGSISAALAQARVYD